MINISNLTNDEVDFYNYTLKNVDLLIYSSLNEVSRDYGCGISFIYRFFEKIQVSGLKEYIHRLSFQLGMQATTDQDLQEERTTKDKKIGDSNLKTIEGIGYKLLADYNINNNLNYAMMKEQLSKLEYLCETISDVKNIYRFGLGHSELAIKELFGMLEKFGIDVCQHFKDENIDQFIHNMKPNSVFIVYSFRGMHPYTLKLIKKVHQKKNLHSFLLTANSKTKFAKYFQEIIYINNNVRNLDYLNKPVLISPFNSLVFFNDFIKNIYYLINQKALSEKMNLNKKLKAEEIYNGLRSIFLVHFL
ncbi:hypothetical protein SCLARK_00287 [Spiroplasma clarkii]|nr:hypothetical protein SCLARK_00287 [Spiroplasma clarkii]